MAQVPLKQQFKTLQRVTSFISYIPNLSKLLNLIMEESKKILNAEASSLLLYDAKEKVLYFEVARGKKGKKLKQIKLKLNEGIAGTCAKERKIINVEDVNKDKRFFQLADKISKFKTKNILAIPLIRKKRLIGVLEVLNKKNGKKFEKQDIELMKIIANEASLAIENAYLYRENLKKAHLAGIGQTMLSLSHDIKNILNGLTGGISLVDEGLTHSEKDSFESGWKIVKKNVERISNLILDMLSFSSKKQPFYQEIKINSFVKEIGELYEEKIKEKGCTLKYELDEKLDTGKFDYQGMERVLLNLISNSYEAIPEEKGEIIIRTKLSNSNFSISVEDNGCGIPKENLKNIFDIFFTTKGHKGTGLGLAVVKKIVEEHHGKIDVSSILNKGTTFTITLPLNPKNEKK